MPGSHERYRPIAQAVMAETNGAIREATKLFNKCVPNHDVQHVSEFLRYWWARRDVQTRKRSGRPHLMAKQDAERLADKWIKGYRVGQQRLGYQSIKHACKIDADFKTTMQAGNIKQPRTLMRNMQQVNKGVKKVPQLPKTTIVPINKTKRMKFCRKHERLPLRLFKAITWMDETSFEVRMPKMNVSADRTGKRLYVEDPYNVKDPRKAITLRAALAVNCAQGAVLLWWCTGTTGITHDPPFQVN